jgi:hypothetical protein
VPTEWLKVMLEEIARKRDEAAQAREELDRRRAKSAKSSDDSAPPRPRQPA